MYRELVDANTARAPRLPGWVYIGEDATRYYYQREGVAGLWGAIKSVAKAVVSPVVNVATSFIPGGTLIKQGISALVNIVRTGTEKQVAEAMAAQLTPEQKAELERAYLERRARELGGSFGVPLAIGAGVLALLLMTRRRGRR